MNASWTRYLPAVVSRKLEGRHLLQRAIGNAGWLAAEKVVRLGVGLFVNVWIARYLGPDQYGSLSYALAFTALFAPLVTLGLDEIIVRDIVHDPGCADETMGSAFWLKLVGSTAAFIAATATVVVLRPSDSLSHRLVGIIAAGSLFQSLNVLEIWFNSQVRSKYAVLARNGAFLVCTCIRIVLILNNAPLITFALVVTVELGICAAGLSAAYLHQGGRFRAWRATTAKARSLLKDSWPLIISFVSVGVYQRIDQVMLRDMAGSAEVGIYSVAVRLAEVWSFIPVALYWSVFPSIIRAQQQSDELFRERLQKFYNLVVLLSYAVALPTSLLAQRLIDTLFGQAYTRAGGMLALLVWAHVFTSMEIARSAFLIAMNWKRIYFISAFIGCVANVALCYFLIPRYGGMGAVIASILAYWIAAHGSCFLFKSTFETGYMLSKALVYPKTWQ